MSAPIPPSASVIAEASEWAMMHGVAIKNPDGTARHCPFSLAPITLQRAAFDHLLAVTPLISQLISAVSEDAAFVQSALHDMAQADPFFGRLMTLHKQLHGTADAPLSPPRQPLLLMRTDYMDDRQQGAKVIEFNGIAAGMGPFGQRATQLHAYVQQQWPSLYQEWVENPAAVPAPNACLFHLAGAIAQAAEQIKASFDESGAPLFVMVVQPDEDNVYDQHLLEVALQDLGVRTVRRTFAQLATDLSTGDGQRLLLAGLGPVDVVYLRAGYQPEDYLVPETSVCQDKVDRDRVDEDSVDRDSSLDRDSESAMSMNALSQTRVFIEQHRVAVNATVSQQLATSKAMQMLLTRMPASDLTHWGLDLFQAEQVKSVLAAMHPISTDTVEWFMTQADPAAWVLKNQGEGGGHCVFGDDIAKTLAALQPDEYAAWALMQRLYPHERDRPALGVRNGQMTVVADLVSEIGLFTAHFNGQPMTAQSMTGQQGYVGYLVRSKPAKEHEGGIHSGKGILDSITLVD
ncbi:glutathione synthase [Photobacterium aphoticum]